MLLNYIKQNKRRLFKYNLTNYDILPTILELPVFELKNL